MEGSLGVSFQCEELELFSEQETCFNSNPVDLLRHVDCTDAKCCRCKVALCHCVDWAIGLSPRGTTMCQKDDKLVLCPEREGQYVGVDPATVQIHPFWVNEVGPPPQDLGFSLCKSYHGLGQGSSERVTTA